MTPAASRCFIFSVAFFFYVLLPISGAFVARSRWRRFRANLHRSFFHAKGVGAFPEGEPAFGLRRVWGELEALEGNDVIWLRTNRGRSVTVEMRGGAVYFMPPLAEKEAFYPHLLPVPLPSGSLEELPWKDVFSLPEGTKMYVSGELHREDGRPTFRSAPQAPLMVLVYNGDPVHLLSRAVWCGRQSNEFWNFITPWSLLSGILLLLIFSVYLLRNSGHYILQFFSIAAALIPALLFLPPGVFLVNLYRTFWDSARRYRAERDLMRLPLPPEGVVPRAAASDELFYSRRPSGWSGSDYSPARSVRLPLGNSGRTIEFPDDPERLAQFCRKKAFYYEALAGVVFAGGLLLNSLAGWLIFSRFL